MKTKCNFCGNDMVCSVGGGFCSYSCKKLYFNQARREFIKLQREFYRKYFR